MDLPGRFSRDGTRVAFTSDRGGAPQIWIADRDGPGLRSLATPGGAINVGSWSPDGTQVAFDMVVDGNADIYTIAIDGGLPARLTSHAANDIDPEWSRDGRWIYFESSASGRSEIWKVATAGGTPVQVTDEGGFEPREASDGRSLYYVDAPRSNGLRFRAQLKRVDVDGGRESVVFKGIRPGAWDITDAGVVFVTGAVGPTPTPGANPPDVLEIYSFAETTVRQLGALPFPVSRFGSGKVLMASRDGRWIVGSHIDRWERDILVGDNVR
jgi:dipeptidyl aminopeptidase/acylaminoacyl peptidase